MHEISCRRLVVNEGTRLHYAGGPFCSATGTEAVQTEKQLVSVRSLLNQRLIFLRVTREDGGRLQEMVWFLHGAVDAWGLEAREGDPVSELVVLYQASSDDRIGFVRLL